jgi:hypothetical protein
MSCSGAAAMLQRDHGMLLLVCTTDLMRVCTWWSCVRMYTACRATEAVWLYRELNSMQICLSHGIMVYDCFHSSESLAAGEWSALGQQ